MWQRHVQQPLNPWWARIFVALNSARTQVQQETSQLCLSSSVATRRGEALQAQFVLVVQEIFGLGRPKSAP